MENIGLILLVALLIINYVNAPEILGFSKDNPKVKTARRLQMVFLIIAVGKFIIPLLGIDEIFSYEVNDKVSVIINAIIIMYFGNLLPKLQIYKNIDIKYAWAIGDEKIWKKASKIFAYLSFVISIGMIILSFYFDSATVTTACQFIWFAIPLLYLLLHYRNKFRPSTHK